MGASAALLLLLLPRSLALPRGSAQHHDEQPDDSESFDVSSALPSSQSGWLLLLAVLGLPLAQIVLFLRPGPILRLGPKILLGTKPVWCSQRSDERHSGWEFGHPRAFR